MGKDDLYRIGIDLGGTKTEAILLAPEDGVILRKRRETPLVEGYRAVLESVSEMIGEAASAVPRGKEHSIGVGIPGSVDAVTGLVRNANSVCLIGRPFPHDLQNLLGRGVRVRNDADCFTLAEARSGAGVGYGLVFGVIMGTGCGGGISIDGEVREGPHRICGEWGHFAVDPQGAPCYCGNRGCVETKISGSGVERAFKGKYGEALTMAQIVAGARAGEERCGLPSRHS